MLHGANQNPEPGGGGVTPHDSLYREALLERGYLQLYERGRDSLLEVYKSVGKSVIWVCKRAQKG